jgi:hypothetical protein
VYTQRAHSKCHLFTNASQVIERNRDHRACLRYASSITVLLDHLSERLALSIGQSGIYTEFKMKTTDYIENTLDLNELIKAYQNICGEHSTFHTKHQQPQQQSRKSK